MRLIFSPQRRDDTLVLEKHGDALTINGEVYDFSPLPSGATLPKAAIGCEWIAGDVVRETRRLIIPIILPHGPKPSPEVANPQPMDLTVDGAVQIPGGGL